jgi:hypothetical protein
MLGNLQVLDERIQTMGDNMGWKTVPSSRGLHPKWSRPPRNSLWNQTVWTIGEVSKIRLGEAQQRVALLVARKNWGGYYQREEDRTAESINSNHSYKENTLQ